MHIEVATTGQRGEEAADRIKAAEVRGYIQALQRIKADCIATLSMLVNERDGNGLPTREARHASSRLLHVIAHEERRLDRAGVL